MSNFMGHRYRYQPNSVSAIDICADCPHQSPSGAPRIGSQPRILMHMRRILSSHLVPKMVPEQHLSTPPSPPSTSHTFALVPLLLNLLLPSFLLLLLLPSPSSPSQPRPSFLPFRDAICGGGFPRVLNSSLSSEKGRWAIRNRGSWRSAVHVRASGRSTVEWRPHFLLPIASCYS